MCSQMIFRRRRNLIVRTPVPLERTNGRSTRRRHRPMAGRAARGHRPCPRFYAFPTEMRPDFDKIISKNWLKTLQILMGPQRRK